MKRPSLKNKAEGFYELFKAEQTGKKPKRKARDGSLPTHPRVPCPDLPELGKGGVTEVCYNWLVAHRITVWRHETGAGEFAGGYGIRHYGIAGAGDLIGVLPDGRHFEIECKSGKGGRWRKNQQEHCKQVLQSNGVYSILHGIPEIELWWKELQEDNQ